MAMLYFVTCEHQNSAGCYRLPDGYAASDLGWDAGRYEKARAAVVDAGLIVFDIETSEIFITGWFETNPAMNPKHAQAVERRISALESDVIREVAEEDFLKSEEIRASRPPKPEKPQLHAVGSRLAESSYLNRRGQ
ncbi:hypothetical protein P6U16_08770 [Rhizobium sp. 32-5/1]|uniref:hypothetical protein n=1 Tax=Rhizobium sp. 32-5/1 TaxID=3019602 RepID=UPI00240D962A|nr:hypothetical protein [Rhizobium sp. 32-5/1]WEZ84648.1 hypothetical protein P6U16_08770 [Rhizobium sp. 32-5/1]